MAINETVSGPNSIAITGTATGENTLGTLGRGDAVGVRGEGKNWHGVAGLSQSTIGGAGVFGASDTGAGVRGESKARFNPAVHGIHTGTEGRGIIGEATDGTGAIGTSGTWVGVYGETNAPASAGASAIWGEGKSGGDGVKGLASGPGKAGVAGFHLTNSGPGIFGQGSPAGHFQGDVTVTGDIQLSRADCAEDFDIVDAHLIEPGTVMVIDEGEALTQSQQAYDKRVAGVISGAGDYKSGIILDKQAARMDRMAVALMGKVYCKVDARYSPIEVGDLLTTSPTPGHAMKVCDPVRASGAIIGKTLQGLTGGEGLLPILVSLQ
jgi:hypothetical protein